MSGQARLLDLDASDVGGQDVALREMISNDETVPKPTPLIGHVTLAPFEAAAFEVVRQ